jgi:hypothetical protein
VTDVAVIVEYSPFGLELFWEMATLVTILDEGSVFKGLSKYNSIF